MTSEPSLAAEPQLHHPRTIPLNDAQGLRGSPCARLHSPSWIRSPRTRAWPASIASFWKDAFPAEILPRAPDPLLFRLSLVTLQVAGLWARQGQDASYCVLLRKMPQTYLYDLTKISRVDNQIADSLAQKYILKNSGRCMSIDQGRLQRDQAGTPDGEGETTSTTPWSQRKRQSSSPKHNLRPKLLKVIHLAGAGQQEEAIKEALELEAEAQQVRSRRRRPMKCSACGCATPWGSSRRASPLMIGRHPARATIWTWRILPKSSPGPKLRLGDIRVPSGDGHERHSILPRNPSKTAARKKNSKQNLAAAIQ